ncbi:MAG TPA: DUF6174 domain-containing protein [Gemmatimonadaceae bacterium]
MHEDKTCQFRVGGDDRGGAPTVDSLFVTVATLIRNPNADLKVSYDAQRGFPAKIEQPSNIPDVGSVTTVTNLQQAP